MGTKVLLSLTLATLISVVGYAWLTRTPATVVPVVTQTPPQAPADQTPPTSAQAGYTLADVAAHNTQSSCWSAINGNVYDLTQWIFQHPGGPSYILAICGIDASAAFDAQHGGQRRPEQELAQFLIGSLAQ